MASDIFKYFEQRAEEEEALATSAHHPVVKATHENLARAYREQAESGQSLSAGLDQPPENRA